MRSTWKHLNLRFPDANIPPLLIKYEIETSSYTIWITDLTFIWMESIDRKRVIQRSFNVDTSIDPSEGPDQLRLFLQSVGSALEQQEGTTMRLMQNNGDQNLLLRTCTPLPGSLKPLDWFAELTLAPQLTLSAELVVPLLGERVSANLEKASLLQQLKEKDLVINKLTDRLQTDGIDLSRVFPSAASSKTGRLNSRQALGKSVKGLAGFDERQWQEHLSSNIVSQQSFVEMVSSAFRNSSARAPDIAQMPTYGNWWNELSNKDTPLEGPHQSPGDLVVDEKPNGSEFQRQSTPAKARIASPPRQTASSPVKANSGRPTSTIISSNDSDSTTDGSDGESKLGKKLNTFDKSRGSLPGVSLTSSQTKPGNSGRHTLNHVEPSDVSPQRASDLSDSDGGVVNPQKDRSESGPAIVDLPVARPTVTKAKAKLGKIGGKGKVSKVSESATSRAAPTQTSRTSSPPRSKAEEDTEILAVSSAGSGWTGRTTVQPGPPLARESSQERANKKREQLKRELEIKSQAGAKKKRRF